MTAPAPAPAPSSEDSTAETATDPTTTTTTVPHPEQPGTSKPISALPTTPTRVGPDSTTPTSTPPSAPASTAAPPPAKAAQPTAAAVAPAGPAPTDGKADSSKSDAAKPDSVKPDTKPDAGKADAKPDDAKPDAPAAAAPPVDASALNSVAGPLLNTALGVPAAALQGAGTLVPGIAGAVMPALAALLGQLGTGAAPAAPASRISGYPTTVASGPISSLAGSGPAADQARTKSSAMADQVAALKQIEQQLGDALGMSSAKTDGARKTLEGIIYDVETAIVSASVQGNTPEAQAAVLKAMQQALGNAGSVVSTAAREKMTDATFVRQLIKDYLSGTAEGGGAAGSGVDHLMAGTAGGRGAGAVAAARRYLGTPYVWGGGGAYGPSGGGFDCSGLTQYAIAQATGGRMILPRTTYDQIHCGRAVPLTALRPGDLVFSNFSAPGVPEHVQLYIGGGQVIEAPQRGVPVQISSLPSNAQARSVL